MRVLPGMILMALLCTTGAGCSLFKKNTNGPQGGGPAPAKFPGVRQDPLMPNTPPPAFPQTGAAARGNSILAGTVIDAYHNPIGNAYVRWVSLEEKDAGAPIDVAADANGNFIIQGVKPGSRYKLIARTKQGDKMLAGLVLTSAPDVHVVIPLREDLVNADTPPIPGTPAYPNKDKAAPGESKNAVAPGAKGPIETPALSVPAAPGGTQVGNPAPAAGAPTFVPGIAETPKRGLPMLTIPSRPDQPAPPRLPPGASKLDTGPPRVPSCALLGNHLENLALKDSNGHAWEYRKQGAGKLILIDFWGTRCIYCRDSMPALNRLQTQYGSRGFEVIGIAIEPGKDERRDADAVNRMCASLQVSYRQLMGRSGNFDAGDLSNFKIKGLPTMMLLNEQGDIIWHHVGRPDPSILSELERTIQRRLNYRTF